MSQSETVHTAFDAFSAWLTTTPGQYILENEKQWFTQTVVDIFGYKAVQLELPQFNTLEDNRIPWKAYAGHRPPCVVQCHVEQLPFSSQSLDLLVLPHVLDFCKTPQAVLQESNRVLMPEGRLLITGFNPWSLWGIPRLCKRPAAPWKGHFLGLPRLKDHLNLLGFEMVRGQYCCYRPPVCLDRLAFLERAGPRWWPVMGAVYCLDLVKRVRGMRVIELQWPAGPARIADAVKTAPPASSWTLDSIPVLWRSGEFSSRRTITRTGVYT